MNIWPIKSFFNHGWVKNTHMVWRKVNKFRSNYMLFSRIRIRIHCRPSYMVGSSSGSGPTQTGFFQYCGKDSNRVDIESPLTPRWGADTIIIIR
jgi:hypothetical protein